MSVFIDNMRAPFGRMIMSHMVADTSQELHAMAARIGVSSRWVQDRGTPREHYDICQSKRQLAIQYGAIEVTRRQLAMKIMDRYNRVRHAERKNR